MLTNLGHGKLIDEKVRHDFTKMTNNNIFISDAIHKATIEVNEEGTVAAAATFLVGAVPCCVFEPPRNITIDKPFLFFIRSGTNVIFAGRMVDPTK